MDKIILASSSKVRRELLKKLGLPFKAVSPNYEEDMTVRLPPLQLAKFLSTGKAEAVAKYYKSHVIIAADTFAVLGGKLLGKPYTTQEARHMLREISGKKLLFISGFTIIDTRGDKRLIKTVETNVYIKKLSDFEIDNYVKTGEPIGKACAFAIQGLGAVIVKRIDGDYYNVMGLPLYDLSEALKKFGIYVFSSKYSALRC